MGKPHETFNKKEVRNRKEKKRQAKEKKRLARKENEKSSSLDDMIAYVDEYGNITSEQPDPTRKEKIKAEDIEIGIPRGDVSKTDLTRRGVVSFFNETKGFGFIKDSDTKVDVFVHINNVIGDIKEGNLVSFKTQKGNKGLAAIDVEIIK